MFAELLVTPPNSRQAFPPPLTPHFPPPLWILRVRVVGSGSCTNNRIPNSGFEPKNKYEVWEGVNSTLYQQLNFTVENCMLFPSFTSTILSTVWPFILLLIGSCCKMAARGLAPCPHMTDAAGKEGGGQRLSAQSVLPAYLGSKSVPTDILHVSSARTVNMPQKKLSEKAISIET